MRLTRAQQQDRTRAAVLAAAYAEFAEEGYSAVTVDRIADRAGLTRGAVYSNFSGKSAVYLAVLLDLVEREPSTPAQAPTHLEDAIEAFARAWLDRLPLAGDTPASAQLRLRSLDGVVDRRPALAGITHLETLLLGRALEACPPAAPGGRRVRLAEVLRTVLDGAGHLAATAPGVGDPFDVVRACEHLADLPLTDTWEPAHLPFVTPAQPVDEPWEAPTPGPDLITGDPVDLGADGVLVLLGADRLGAAEEAVRATGDRVTIVVASDAALVRLRIRDLAGCLRRAVDPTTWPGFALLLDDGRVAAALGVPPEPGTEHAIRVAGGRVVARAAHRGAGHAAASR
ncbi:TetR/AcrR family transcriptional regulator [Cryptosporangium arvum]|uniref:TetR/AcrR family transcriptional regulator n=1 Tax=Cryptosporangium arvum TaxID=80871 RepID=UPI0004B3FD76|nr:TetR/AcrR family transcriptional regulator [Cryptosporangium arvum]